MRVLTADEIDSVNGGFSIWEAVLFGIAACGLAIAYLGYEQSQEPAAVATEPSNPELEAYARQCELAGGTMSGGDCITP